MLKEKPQKTAKLHHKTTSGKYFLGDSKSLLSTSLKSKLKGRVQLILTSPPFPLNNKKSYGNMNGDKFKSWLTSLAPMFADILTPDGSIVIEMGNAWEPNRPVQSLLHLESLIGFLKHSTADLRLCQQFVCYNPSRLPSPAQWVTVKRIRLTDSYTHVWWMAKSDFPKADNSKVLRPYSKSMERLLQRQSYNSGNRPSEHNISKTGFLKDHGGSIAHNFFEITPIIEGDEVRLPNVLRLSNTDSNSYFMRRCRELGIKPHPARMQMGLAAFFIELLTDPGDLVLDPFAGSNTTGYTAQLLGRNWIGIDLKEDYARQSEIRLEDPALNKVGGTK
ncbi:MAG: site-specific DNA-methyltransferase [Meiothermus sp.]|nr:site-specific DNA-methyltransferase [Meiothermus sp.]